MEFHCSNIIQVTGQSKQTFFRFVVPYFHFVIVTTTYEERLSLVEVHSSYRAYRLVIRTW